MFINILSYPELIAVLMVVMMILKEAILPGKVMVAAAINATSS